MKVELNEKTLKTSRQRRNYDVKMKQLDWLEKEESKELLTEEELFQMPLPEAWKLPYMK